MLAALMNGQALTGSELADLARVTRPTASQHLAKLTQARLIGVIKQGRFSYYRIVSPLVARMLESIIAVAAIDVPGRAPRRTTRLRLRARAMTISPAGSALPLPIRLLRVAISFSPTRAARFRMGARIFSRQSG